MRFIPDCLVLMFIPPKLGFETDQFHREGGQTGVDGARIFRYPRWFGYSATLRCEVSRVKTPGHWNHRLANDAQRFLELMASVPNEFFVPTLDIDLAWQYVGVSPPPPGLQVED